MRSIRRALLLSLVISGCASAPAARTRATNVERATIDSCGLTDAVMARAELLEVPGTRVRVQVPRSDEAVVIRGMPIIAHECGLSIAIVPAPLAGHGAAFLDGAVHGSLEEHTRRGLTCEAGRSGAAWRCVGPGTHVFVRRIGSASEGAVVMVEGPSADAAALQRIAGSAVQDVTAVFDPLEQMGIALEVPEGMALASDAVAGDLRYRASGPPDRLVADVSWIWMPYASLDAHADSSEWTDREVGRVAAELAARDVDSLTQGTLQLVGRSEDGSVTEVTIDAIVGGAPVVVYVCAVRDAFGMFYAVGRMPTHEAGSWIPRLRAHTATLRALD